MLLSAILVVLCLLGCLVVLWFLGGSLRRCHRLGNWCRSIASRSSCYIFLCCWLVWLVCGSRGRLVVSYSSGSGVFFFVLMVVRVVLLYRC